MKNILITQTVVYSKKRGYTFSLSKDWYDYSNKIRFNLIPWDYKIIPSLLRKKKYMVSFFLEEMIYSIIIKIKKTNTEI